MTKRDIKDPTVKRTRVFATKNEVEEIKGLFDTPIITLGRVFNGLHPMERVHEIALSHDLPETKGFYGIDLGNREFITRKEIKEPK